MSMKGAELYREERRELKALLEGRTYKPKKKKKASFNRNRRNIPNNGEDYKYYEKGIQSKNNLKHHRG